MSLKKLTLPMAVVEIPGSEDKLAVRGISFAHISVMTQQHRDLLEALYHRFTSDGSMPDNADVGAILKELIGVAPALVATIIVLACGDDPEDPEVQAIAASLPMPVQAEALEQIMRLTFAREGGVKKLLETVIRATTALNQNLPKL